MPNLPALRRADCGHYVRANARPTGTDNIRGTDVYLCDECRAALKRPKIERKA